MWVNLSTVDGFVKIVIIMPRDLQCPLPLENQYILCLSTSIKVSIFILNLFNKCSVKSIDLLAFSQGDYEDRFLKVLFFLDVYCSC